MGTDPGPPTVSSTRAATVGLGAAVALVLAVALAVDPWGLRPYTTARWALVGVCAAAATAAVLPRPPRVVAVLGALLLGWLALATLTALDPVMALVGHPRRHLGLAGWVVAALALLAGTGLTGRTRVLGRAAVAGAVVTGAAAVADVAGWDPFGTRFAGGRAGGLLGQPLYLAVVALLLAPVAAGVALDRREPGAWRVAGALGAAGSSAALAASQTRGAWLGAAVAVAAVAVGRRPQARMAAPGDARRDGAAAPRGAPDGGHTGPLVVRLGGRPLTGAAASMAGVVAVGALLLAAAPRLAEAADAGAPGGRGRLDEWVVAARVVGAHPITGVGPEGYRIAAPAHVDDGYTLRHGRDEVIDRAHSGPLDVAAAGGIPAGLLYVVLVGTVVARCLRVVGRARDPVLAGAAAAVIGWSVQQVVGFPIAEVDPLAWLLAGLVVASPVAGPARGRGADVARIAGPVRLDLAADLAGPDADARPRTARRRRAAAVGARAAARLSARVARPALAVLAAVLAVAGLTAVSADRHLARADAAARRGELAAALASADRATDRRPDDVDAWYLAARLAATPDGLPAVDRALDRVEAGLDRVPGDPALRHLHTDLLVDRAVRSGLGEDLATAAVAARSLVADDPSSPAAHRDLGLVLAAQGRTAEARTALGRAVALEPDDAAARAALDDLVAGR